MFSKATISAIALLAGLASSHSWLECTKTTNIENVEAAIADVNAPLKMQCEGFPRNKVNNGDWIAESSHYLWELKPNGPACNPVQKPGVAAPGAPAATASPGETLKLRHWGNGHSDYHIGSPRNRDPGLVRVYWAHAKETEIENASQLTQDLLIAEGNFTSTDAVIAKDGRGHMNEKGNFLELNLPKNMETGRHAMVWTWAWLHDEFTGEWRNQYSTCFDVYIENGAAAGTGESRLNTVQAYSDEPKQVSSKCSETCYRGGMTDLPCTGADCPPCRYSSGNGINCFDVGSDGKCPFNNGYDCSTGSSV